MSNTANALPDLRGLTEDALSVKMEELGVARYRVRQLTQWLYHHNCRSIDEMLNLSKSLRDQLAAEFTLHIPECVRVLGSEDTTRKYLFRIGGGDLIETVLIPASLSFDGERSDRMTLCVSSQVGCAYGCKFCASGLDGFKRNLTTAEIVSQVLEVMHLSGKRIGNLVFMGMGEPMANYDAVMQAIIILNAHWGCNIGARHITVSTSGLVPRIRDMADQPLQIRLAISLHGATDEVRNQIMPVNQRYPLAELFDACDYYVSHKKQKIFFEFILIKGVNDDPAHARVLARHAKRLNSKVNLIPYNRVDGLDWERPGQETQEAFLTVLRSSGVVATLRREKGHDIDAACGQLRRQTLQSA